MYISKIKRNRGYIWFIAASYNGNIAGAVVGYGKTDVYVKTCYMAGESAVSNDLMHYPINYEINEKQFIDFVVEHVARNVI